MRIRIPLVRFEGDETRIAPWEWLFWPIVLIVWIPVAMVSEFQREREEERLPRRLAEVGRFMEWSEVEPKLRQGVGTLIVENWEPKGPFRSWWTEDDLIAATPLPLPTKENWQLDDDHERQLREFAKACVTRYLDLESGTAKFAMIELQFLTTRELAEKYPKRKIVTIVHLFDDDELFIFRDYYYAHADAAEEREKQAKRT